ncbi:pentapeptide repeat-containing protein [Jatrophihabitans cynanchi]|uniref:pentapeptide repeat-containing protein n=1 Tax=Jatrophihabitans cynanchi TaxID=2944128 RepID=UPI0038B2FE68
MITSRSRSRPRRPRRAPCCPGCRCCRPRPADLDGADLDGADLDGADLDQADPQPLVDTPGEVPGRTPSPG